MRIYYDAFSQVNYLTKLVALRPGKTLRDMIKNVMQGKDEGADNSESGNISSGIAGRVSFSVYFLPKQKRDGCHVIGTS